MSIINYNQRGSIYLDIIGNSLVVADSVANPDYYNGGYITTLTTVSAGSGAPLGTTLIQSQNGSSAVLNMSTGKTVNTTNGPYLCWITSSAATTTNILFKTPGIAAPVTIAATTSETVSGGILQLNVSNVAAYTTLPGTYTVSNVAGPATITPGSSQSAVSWWLVSVINDPSLNLENENLVIANIGLSAISANNTNFINTIQGFEGTPTYPTPQQYYLSTNSFGSINNGSQLYIGTVSPPTGVVGQVGPWNGQAPYISANNAFSGNILIADTSTTSLGLLDTSGTLGTYNKNPFPGAAPVPFARTNFNLMGLNIGNLLTINQPAMYINSVVSTPNTLKTAYNTGNYYVSKVLRPSYSAGSSVTANKAYVKYGDTITYSVNLINGGTGGYGTAAGNTNTLSGITFIPGTLKINGVSSVTATPASVSLGTISYGIPNTITFDAIVETIPTGLTSVSTTSNLGYNWKPFYNNSDTYLVMSAKSYSATISAAYLTMNKISDKVNTGLNTTITYTVGIKNTGTVTANNVVFVDTMPLGTIYVASSLTQDGITLPSSPASPGATLSNIGPGVTSTLTFKVFVVSVPSTNMITNSSYTGYSFIVDSTTTPVITGSSTATSNTATTTLVHSSLNMQKQVNKTLATFGDILTYTIPITNVGNTAANNIILIDTLPSTTTYIPNSLVQNGVIIPGGPTPQLVTLNSIAPGATSTISFMASVNTLTSVISPITNSATTTFTYVVDSTVTLVGSSNSNIVSTNLAAATFGTVTISSSAAYATCNDIVTITVSLPNTGTTTASNVVILNTIPNGMSFVPNSVTVNGVTIPGATPVPPTGITISTVAPGSTYVVKYNLKVNC